MNKINISYVVIISLILFASFTRIIPHIPNFTPIGAMALFGGAYLKNKYHAFIIPLASLWVSDLIINNFIFSFYSKFTWFYPGFLWQYTSFVLIIMVGYFFLKKLNFKNVIMTSIFSSLVFYLVTNFGVWISGSMYTIDLKGFITCYVMALPFLKGTILGFICYSTFLFGTLELSKHKFQILKN
ncbi:MAG: hypothetical protein CMC38_05480 [Flavobacteriaceae bacterium]|nr:hypothetical protein [Flavobacteriaceae bacterium]|tara:strand:- start:2837 stop:3388 length:552 start_codon:yes stop_codon:yes gene_type:complete